MIRSIALSVICVTLAAIEEHVVVSLLVAWAAI